MSEILEWIRSSEGQSWTGLLTILGFILSVILLWAAGRIRRHLKGYATFRQYQQDRVVFAKRLKAIISLLRENITGREKELISEVQTVLSRVETYKKFLPVKAWWYIKRAQWMTSGESLATGDAHRLVSMLSYLRGKLLGKDEFIL